MTHDEIVKAIGNLIYDNVPIREFCPYCDGELGEYALSSLPEDYEDMSEDIMFLVVQELKDRGLINEDSWAEMMKGVEQCEE